MRISAVTDRLLAHLVRARAERALARFIAEARDATAIQDRVLATLLRANAESDYGKHHGFASIRGYREFISNVPVCTYADLQPWIERVRGGDTGAMFGRGQRVRMFAMTSGTVDAPKYVPVTDRFLADQRAAWSAFGGRALMDHPQCFGRLIVQVTSPMDEETAPCGIPCGSITGLMAATQSKLVRKYYVAPLPVAYIPDMTARRYTIMRLAMPADVGWMVTASPATVLQLARIGEQYAESIIRDIRDGTLAGQWQIPDQVRKALAPRLKPDPRAARRLERIHARHGHLRPLHYWNLAFLANWTGGTMGLYLREYPKYYGDTPVRDIGLMATEGRMSIPIKDGTPAGIAAVSSVFLEFIPAAEYGSDRPVTLRTHEVEAGEEYFILLTTSAGFYRYDICDCIHVVGFEGQAPVIEFLHKGAHVSSITGEKITEHQVVIAFQRAAADLGIASADFVLAPKWADPPFYRLYVERLNNDSETPPLDFATALDSRLRRINIEYESKRSSGRLGPIEIRQVRPDALKELDHERATRYRAANEQFKHQFLYTTPGDDDVLAALVLPTTHQRPEAPEHTGDWSPSCSPKDSAPPR